MNVTFEVTIKGELNWSCDCPACERCKCLTEAMQYAENQLNGVLPLKHVELTMKKSGGSDHAIYRMSAGNSLIR